ncbi:division plane positioning ATPase MipZ [Desulfobaculum bizertense]|uniref:Plasmid segregation oscillating ATPase ParF n=1 Tax=Desulfobaculum bizertense DSM 18034 TaxID=1121442 RepID=A0A1T4WZ40_9BACT|nr:division plane positioning ATPase MipZ [Desulfobaculum bizertense]UIJ39553.1 AAA family ATPase [Desulfobaculum bizertense]SKA82632.1 plasmid segregation oscillating ATPase ParF [Desulfobaculum bizertense DSM 18034]
MILLVGSQKGGCGKSTMAVNICAALVCSGHDVVLVDADRQGTAATWAQDRSENTDLPPVHCVQRYENIRETLLDLGKRYEHVVVDAAGRDSRELRTGMTAADVLLVPFRPSQPDLDTLPALQDIIVQATDLNPKLTAKGLLTMAPTNPVVQETQQAQDYLHDFPEIDLLQSIVGDRKAFRDAMSEGKGVVEMHNSKAKAEVEAVLLEVYGD